MSVFHIEITVIYPDTHEVTENNDRFYDCEQELRTWLIESPINCLKFHGIEHGVCASHAILTDYTTMIDMYNLIKDYQSLADLANKYDVEISIAEPWNNQIKPHWYTGTNEEWMTRD